MAYIVVSLEASAVKTSGRPRRSYVKLSNINRHATRALERRACFSVDRLCRCLNEIMNDFFVQ